MQVNNILSGLSDAASLAKGRSSAAATTASQAAAAAAPTVLNGNSAAVRAILAQYDVTDITPNEFSQMTQKLFDAGAISQQDLQELNGVRTDLLAAGADSDESVNLVDFYTQKIQAAQGQLKTTDPATQQQQLAPLVRRLDWMEKFKTMKDEPAAGISVTA